MGDQMKKLLLVLGMVLMMGCASAPLSKPKYDAQLPSAPTQYEVLKQVRFEAEIKNFEIWWAQEKILFEVWLSDRAGMKIDLTLREATFVHDYRAGIIYVRASSVVDEEDLYLVITKPEGMWKVVNIIVPVLEETTEVDDKDEQF